MTFLRSKKEESRTGLGTPVVTKGSKGSPPFSPPTTTPRGGWVSRSGRRTRRRDSTTGPRVGQRRYGPLVTPKTGTRSSKVLRHPDPRPVGRVNCESSYGRFVDGTSARGVPLPGSTRTEERPRPTPTLSDSGPDQEWGLVDPKETSSPLVDRRV